MSGNEADTDSPSDQHSQQPPQHPRRYLAEILHRRDSKIGDVLDSPIELRDRNTSFLNSIREIPSASEIQAEHHISLIDQTKPVGVITPPNEAQLSDAERIDSTVPPTPRSPSDPALLRRITNNSLSLQNSVKQQIVKQKYSKYDRKRYECDDNTETQIPNGAQSPRPGDIVSHGSVLDRAGAKAKGLVKRKRGLGRGKNKEDSVIDILYENQRGFFFFGIPRYSASSLLPSDPNAWQNAEFRSSPVDIRNAQVPDPSWEWAWKGWYVDMSRDVDEEGWEYSLVFKNGFNWHGNHPWFHSFVRRRRWLRMRKRRDLSHHVTSEKAHELTADYFTIHPKTVRPTSEEFGKTKINELARLKAQAQGDDDIEKMEVTDIASLIRALKKSSVDREKLLAVRKFVADGGEELYYLSEHMPDIMNVFVYQSSRKQLLSELMSKYDQANARIAELKAHNHHDGDVEQNDHDAAVRHAQNILNAVKAASAQVKRLEYWSDIKGVDNGDDPDDTYDMAHPEPSFRNKQKANEPGNKLHAHPEHASNGKPNEKPSFETGESSHPSKKSSLWFDTTQGRPSIESSEGEPLDRYVTATESVSDLGSPEMRPKSKKGKDRMAEVEPVATNGTESTTTATANDDSTTTQG